MLHRFPLLLPSAFVPLHFSLPHSPATHPTVCWKSTWTSTKTQGFQNQYICHHANPDNPYLLLQLAFPSFNSPLCYNLRKQFSDFGKLCPDKQLLQSLRHVYIYYMPGRLFQKRVTKKQYTLYCADLGLILSHMSLWWIEKHFFRALLSTEVIDGRWAIHQTNFFSLWPGPSHAICQMRHWSLFGRVWEQKWVQTGMSSVIQSDHSSDAFVYEDRIRNEAQTHRGEVILHYGQDKSISKSWIIGFL